MRVSGGSGVEVGHNRAYVPRETTEAFIDAPVERVWELVSDVDRHPEWWPRVVEVECEGLEEGCTYRMVTKTPVRAGRDGRWPWTTLDECRNLSIRCINTGTFVRFELTEAQNGTFLDGRDGDGPERFRLPRVRRGRRPALLPSWMAETFAALERAALRGEPGKWAILDSNQGPRPYQRRALTD